MSSGADEELAAKLREAIHWCNTCLAHHAPQIGADRRGLSVPLEARQTAIVLVQMLVSFDLGDYAAEIPIDYYTTHQRIVGLLTEYKNRFSAILDRLETGDAEQAPAISESPSAGANSQIDENTRRIFPNGIPENQDIVDLVVRLNTELGSGKSRNQIAREFTDETAPNDKRARSLLAQIRRLTRQGHVRL